MTDRTKYSVSAEIAGRIAEIAQPNAAVANETPLLFEHYLKKAGRGDIRSVSLSDKESVSSLRAGDFVVAANGRRYKSNSEYLTALNEIPPTATTHVGDIESARIYKISEPEAEALRSIASDRNP